MVLGMLLGLTIHRMSLSDALRWGLHHSRCLLRIFGGLFVVPHDRPPVRRLLELLSRFTWQLPQTLIGLATALIFTLFDLYGGVMRVDYFLGATLVVTRRDFWGAVSQGNTIVGCASLAPDIRNALFRHEYGHCLQSQAMGWAYYPRVGIPSLLALNNHSSHPVEQDANRRASLFFFQSQTHHLSVRPACYDYLLWLLPLIGPILASLIHQKQDHNTLKNSTITPNSHREC